MKKKLALILMIAFPAAKAMASPYAFSHQQVDKITLLSGPDGNRYVQFSCVGLANKLFEIYQDGQPYGTKLFNQEYAALLTAKSTGGYISLQGLDWGSVSQTVFLISDYAPNGWTSYLTVE